MELESLREKTRRDAEGINKKLQVSIRVRTGPGKPGKSWNFIKAFSRTGKSWKKAPGPGKIWKSVKLC